MFSSKKFLKLNIIIFLALCCSIKSNFALLDIKQFTGGDKSVDLLFATDLESKKNKLEQLEKRNTQFQKRMESTTKTIVKSLNKINSDVTELKSRLKNLDQEEEENTNKLISLLGDRKEHLTKLQELWKKTEEVLLDHIKLLKDIITSQQKEISEEVKFVYSWKDFKLSQEKVMLLFAKLQEEKDKKESLKKQKIAEKETLVSLQKQIDTKNKQRENPEIKDIDIKILEQEISILNEKANYSNLKIENLEDLIKYKDDQIFLNQYNLNKTEVKLDHIEQHMVIEPRDIENAKNEWEEQKQKSFKIKEQLNKFKEPKKAEVEKITNEITSIQKKLTEIKKEDDPAEVYLLQIEIQKRESSIGILNKEIQLIELKEDRENILTNKQEQQFAIINSYQKITQEKENLDYWFNNFKNQKDLVVASIKNLEESKNNQSTTLLETNRIIDNLKTKEEDIKTKKDTEFKNKQKIYTTIITDLEDIKKNLFQKQQLIQEYLAINSDLINKQETILSQYDFIVANLEEKIISFNIWKRSPKAITIDASVQSMADLEKFFIKFFWNIPKYLSPTNLWISIQDLNYNNYLGLVLFLLFFTLAFIGLKKLFFILEETSKTNLTIYNKQKGYLYLNIITNTFAEYALKNYKVLFTWLFLYLHVFFNFKNIFASIQFMANKFSITAFYLASIPILIYLFSQFLLSVKSLNKKLSFMFFAEKLQTKFVFLIAFILYATATLIPLRRAFLVYADFPSEFPNVTLAAYTLILVIVILLFFGKEDVLTLIPSTNKFSIWLKSKIDKYYYPVFIFFMSLLILSNPYIGYYNLAWYLAFALPSTILLFYGMFFIHYYIRNLFMSFFIKEEDDEIIDKFEYAKTYYAFFVITTFSILLFFTVILISRIWRFDLTITSLWQALSQDWVIKPIPDVKLGVIQLLSLTTFIASGFFISSLLHRAILNRLFEIFRTEPGTQNTISRISHYVIIIVSILLGFANIQLTGFIMWGGGFLAIGLGFGLKDVAADFVAGFFVLIERPIEIGNFVQIDETTKGTVRNISARATTIRTARNFSVIVPNKDLVTKTIINWGQGRLAVGFELTIMVDYQSDINLVKKLIIEILDDHPLILKVPQATIRLDEFEDNGLKFFSRAFISSRRVREQWDIASDLRIEILNKFRENNIIIPFPQRVVHMSNDIRPDYKKPINVNFDH